MTTDSMTRPSDISAGRASAAALERHIAAATQALLGCQQPDGHWVSELEADATIPAEYVLMRHYFAEPIDRELEAKIAAYLRRIQGAHGGWPLFHDGAFDMSASVKAYFALKMIGDSPDDDHMRRAREAILARGGAERSNVFTRILLSLYGVTTWRSAPVMPVEIMLLPRWFPFHMSKISYWARTVIAPLLVLGALKPKARNPKGVTIDELFLQSPKTVGGVKKAKLKEAPSGSMNYKFKLVGKDANILFAPLTVATDDVRVTLEIENGGVGVCFESTLAACVNNSPAKDSCDP